MLEKFPPNVLKVRVALKNVIDRKVNALLKGYVGKETFYVKSTETMNLPNIDKDCSLPCLDEVGSSLMGRNLEVSLMTLRMPWS